MGHFTKLTERYETQRHQGDSGEVVVESRGVVAVDRRNSCPSEDL